MKGCASVQHVGYSLVDETVRSSFRIIHCEHDFVSGWYIVVTHFCLGNT